MVDNSIFYLDIWINEGHGILANFPGLVVVKISIHFAFWTLNSKTVQCTCSGLAAWHSNCKVQQDVDPLISVYCVHIHITVSVINQILWRLVLQDTSTLANQELHDVAELITTISLLNTTRCSKHLLSLSKPRIHHFYFTMITIIHMYALGLISGVKQVAFVPVMNLGISMGQNTTVPSDLMGPNKELWTSCQQTHAYNSSVLLLHSNSGPQNTHHGSCCHSQLNTNMILATPICLEVQRDVLTF